MNFQDLAFILEMLSFITAVVLYIYLLKYLQKEKPSLLKKISLQQAETLMRIKKFPIWMKIHPFRFFVYLMTKDKEDDKKSISLKLGYLISLLIFIFLFVYNFITF